MSRPTHRKRFPFLRTRLLAASVALLALVATAGAQMPAEALAKVHCKPTTGVGQNDPIVDHNAPVGGAAHMHRFFGSTVLPTLANPNAANYEDLVGQGTVCENASDTAAYWVPVLEKVATGQEIVPSAFIAYYRPFTGVGGPQFGPGEPFPADTRLVARGHYNWGCGQNSNNPGPYQAIPDCTGSGGGPGDTLTAHIDFPNCWDGVLPNHQAADVGDTSDNAHYAYSVKTKVKKGVFTEVCPAGFDHQMISLREQIQWPYLGAGNDIALSSDLADGTTDGVTMHGDFWNTWKQDGLVSLTKNCINSGGVFTSAECG